MLTYRMCFFQKLKNPTWLTIKIKIQCSIFQSILTLRADQIKSCLILMIKRHWIENIPELELAADFWPSVPGDLWLEDITGEFRLEDITAISRLEDVTGDFRLDDVPGDLWLEDITGDFWFGDVTGDFRLEDVMGDFRLGVWGSLVTCFDDDLVDFSRDTCLAVPEPSPCKSWYNGK